MRILSIETSCDETAVSVIDAKGTLEKPKFKLLGNALYSQAKLHEQYGGVMPNLAKREHAKNLIPLLTKALDESGFLKLKSKNEKGKFPEKVIKKILVREPELIKKIKTFNDKFAVPKIDAIAVTYGPGLEPALWVGITVAEALGAIWNLPVVPVNHMEGHVVSVLFTKAKTYKLKPIVFPTLALLISGGHTELVFSKKLLHYVTIGKTRDDALGECYDKVARMMGLPYPGGPEISKLAEKARESKTKNNPWHLPRPMIYTKDFDFSFSGLKTSVLYKIRDHGKLSEQDKLELAEEFEEAVTEVVIEKTRKAIVAFKPRSLIIGGGVISNKHIRKAFVEMTKDFENLTLHIPEKELATDNSVMIGMAGYLHIVSEPSILKIKKKIAARGHAILS
jgi:N6-L-threonylcarbamoyladenine synthase